MGRSGRRKGFDGRGPDPDTPAKGNTMKLYDFPPAVNARRVRAFIAEKGLDVPLVEVDVRAGALHEEPLRSRNPFSVVPFLELDDGACIGESMAICRYLEELHPENPLMGRDPKERALVEMWNRRVELDGFVHAIHALRNASPLYAGRVLPGTRNDLAQLPEITRRGRDALAILFGRLDARLASVPFLAGERFSVADLTGYFTVQVAAGIDAPIPAACSHLARWHRDLSERPSTRA